MTVAGPENFPPQVALSRCVRFTASLATGVGEAGHSEQADRRRNSFSALPNMLHLGLHCEMTVTVRGVPDAITGYLMNISAIDAHVRERVIPIIETAAQRRDAVAPSAVLQQAFQALHEPMGEALDSVRWNLSPYYSLTMSAAAPNRVLITQSFEFAAAHRLHCDELDAERNRSIFGKCNNPSGHGHNYRVEVSAETSLDDRGVNAFSLVTLEGIVDDVVIRRFDHKHLNTDTAEFKNVNPSVEHITRACFDLLARPIAEAGATLRRVTVWETEKTSCTYPA